MKIPITE